MAAMGPALLLPKISRGQAMNCKMSDAAVRHRIRPGGPWQLLVPGIYLSRTGTPTTFQRIWQRCSTRDPEA